MSRGSRLLRWVLVLGATGVLPGFVLRCDKAAINFQRGFLLGLGEDTADLLAAQFGIGTQETQ